MFVPIRILIVCAFAFLALAHVRADIFHLEEGGQVVGELVDRGEDGEYVVHSNLGAKVILSRQQVDRVEQLNDVDIEYTRRSRSLPDTADAHRALAKWCKENKLGGQAEHHLRRVVELDPHDEQARLSLGLQKHQGRWMTREEIMQERGLKPYKGGYKTPQELFLIEQEEVREKAEADWYQNIRLWVRWLDDPRRSTEAADNIAMIRDPHAAVAIVKLLKRLNRIEDQEIRDFLTEVLAELRHPLAVTTLVDFSLEDPLREVRLKCLDYLLARGDPISLTPYVSALNERRNSNEMINRAGEALQVLGNKEAISPLIDALITTHKYKDGQAPPGEFNASFDRNGGRNNAIGGGGMTLGGGPKVIVIDHKNMAVRQALVALAGGSTDFEFDQQAWRRWYVSKQIQEFVDTRRDR